MWALFGQIETTRRVTWYVRLIVFPQSVSDSLWHLNAAHSNTFHSRGLGNDEEQEQADQVPRRKPFCLVDELLFVESFWIHTGAHKKDHAER